MALAPPRSCLIQMAILDIVISAKEPILFLYGEVPYVGGGPRDVYQGEG